MNYKQFYVLRLAKPIVIAIIFISLAVIGFKCEAQTKLPPQPKPQDRLFYVQFSKTVLDSLAARSNRAIIKLQQSDAKAKDVYPATELITGILQSFFNNYQQQLAADTVKKTPIKK